MAPQICLLPHLLQHSATLYLSQLLILDIPEWELNQERVGFSLLFSHISVPNL